MSQHFLLSSAAKTLTLAQVFRMTDAEAETMFRALRWQDTQGAPVCPKCGGLDAYECRRPKGLLRFRCKACAKDFSITNVRIGRSHILLGSVAVKPAITIISQARICCVLRRKPLGGKITAAFPMANKSVALPVLL